ncbi:MAG TPA: hypothetical protein EYH40_03395 [Desulfurococcales archaeon]|nr:hypothetical protein [Desulfurococcales archaeon]
MSSSSERRLCKDRRYLQVALDVVDLDRALRIAREAYDGGVDIIEAGTPLIKSEGLRAVRVLRENFPDTLILADMKTMDTGFLEVELAAKAGADIVTVLGVADDQTIIEALKAARKYNIYLEVDLIAHPSPIKRAIEVKKLGADIICLHIGIDVQRKLKFTIKDMCSLIALVKRDIGEYIAVAGGINAETVGDIVLAGADIIVVGSAITKSQNPKEAAAIIKNRIREVLEGKVHP